MNVRAWSAGVGVAVLLLAVPFLRLVGPLLGGLVIGVLLVQAGIPDDAPAGYVDHSVFGGITVGLVYFLMASGIGTGLLGSLLPDGQLSYHVVGGLQPEFLFLVEGATGRENLHPAFFAFLVSIYALVTMVLGELLGRYIATNR